MSAAAVTHAVTIGCERYPCREWERRTERVTAQSDLSDILEREHTVSFTTHQHAKNSHTKHNHTEHTTYKLNYEQATELEVSRQIRARTPQWTVRDEPAWAGTGAIRFFG